MNSKSSPIIICGSHGGGTSYLTKLLRFSGLFVGNDAGGRNTRKYHESESFRDWNFKILQELCLDRHAMNIQHVEKCHKNMPKMVNLLADSIKLHDISPKFYGPCKGIEPWGWKDPRNSLTIPVWEKVFPNARALIIQRKHTNKLKNSKSKSRSGGWFKKHSNPKVRDAYMNPNCRCDSYVVNFDEVILDFNGFNRLLKWIGLRPLIYREFVSLLARTNLEFKEVQDKTELVNEVEMLKKLRNLINNSKDPRTFGNLREFVDNHLIDICDKADVSTINELAYKYSEFGGDAEKRCAALIILISEMDKIFHTSLQKEKLGKEALKAVLPLREGMTNVVTTDKADIHKRMTKALKTAIGDTRMRFLFDMMITRSVDGDDSFFAALRDIIPNPLSKEVKNALNG